MMPRRLERERQTVEMMVEIYCKSQHGHHELCASCAALAAYAAERILACRYSRRKPACSKCITHCYMPAMQENIRVIMRFAGPRMLWKHPLMTIFHLFDTILYTVPGKDHAKKRP